MKSKKDVEMISLGKRADSGIYKIDRLLPNRYSSAIGPFILLDHILPIVPRAQSLLENAETTGPHPSRGLAILTYVLKGEAEHRDSKGNHNKVNSGGIQWMNAGSGILHEESLKIDPNTNDLLIHCLKFWISLPSKNKAEDSDYLSIESSQVPIKELANKPGWIKVIIGKYKGLSAKIPTYSSQFIYHLHLDAERYFTFKTTRKTVFAAFLPLHDVVINDNDYHKGELIGFGQGKGEIRIKNVSANAADVILFGGKPYTEPIIVSEAFAMNTEHEITLAYNDYYDGKYGEIKYDELIDVDEK